MTVRAKFRLNSYETQIVLVPVKDDDGRQLKDDNGGHRYEHVEQRTLKLSPVYSDKPGTENKLFWDASPGGEIRLNVVNQAAWQHFELGKEYYVDFIPAEA